MASGNAATIIAARFSRQLGKGDDVTAHPDSALLATAGTETRWDAEDGYPRRDRTVRAWFALWPDLETARSYFEARTKGIPILAEAIETVAILGQPFACHGEVNWSPDGKATSVYPALAPRPKGEGPVMVVTTLGLGDPESGLVEFGRGVTAVRTAFAENPAVFLDVNLLPDMPLIDGPTLTLWRSEREMMTGAYRTDPHRTVMGLRNGATARASFTRLAVVAAEGHWSGKDLGILTGPGAA
jgi:hypothetical protein